MPDPDQRPKAISGRPALSMPKGLDELHSAGRARGSTMPHIEASRSWREVAAPRP